MYIITSINNNNYLCDPIGFSISNVVLPEKWRFRDFYPVVVSLFPGKRNIISDRFNIFDDGVESKPVEVKF